MWMSFHESVECPRDVDCPPAYYLPLGRWAFRHVWEFTWRLLLRLRTVRGLFGLIYSAKGSSVDRKPIPSFAFVQALVPVCI